jgi:hypothetical protein
MNSPLFNSNETEKLFRLNGLSDFEALWALDCEWFEEPNYRRNGWSGVVRHGLKHSNGDISYVFIKRQENHNYKTMLHPITGVPTFRREFININRLNRANIPTLTLLYYGERKLNGKLQSILITQSLETYQSFEDFFQDEKSLPSEQVNQIMQLAGKNIRLLHNAHYRHGSLYPKHFFVKADKDLTDVRLIDLEKLKWYPFSYLVRKNDLSRVIRHRGPISKEAIGVFIESYLKTGTDLSQSPLAEQLKELLSLK